MAKSITIFENEEAVRLFDYFVSYREIISKTETVPPEVTAQKLES